MGKKPKKKVNTNRGFSTVSIPSKQLPQPDIVDQEKYCLITSKATPKTTPDLASSLVKHEETTEIPQHDLSSQKLSFLKHKANTLQKQIFNDTHLQNIEHTYDFEFPLGVENDLISIAQEEASYQDFVTTDKRTDSLSSAQVKDKRYTIYMTLQDLGFSDEDIERSMVSLPSLNIEDHLNWMCVNINSERLPEKLYDNRLMERQMDITSIDRSTDTDIVVKEAVDDNRAVSVEQPFTTKEQKLFKPEDDKKDNYKMQVLKTALKYEYNNIDDDEEGSSVNDQYVKAKIGRDCIESKLSAIGETNEGGDARGISSADLARMRAKMKNLNVLLDSLSGHYEFDKKAADKLYAEETKRIREERKKVEIEQSQLENRNKEDHDEQGNNSPTDIFDQIQDDDEDDQLGIFGNILEQGTDALDTSQPSSQATSYTYVDFKSSSWRRNTPKNILKTYCEENNYQTPTYAHTNIGREMWRATVKIQLSNAINSDLLKLEMPTNLVAKTTLDAENVVAVVGLFRLDPESGLYHTLPPLLKNIWNQLKSEHINEQNIQALKKYERQETFINSLPSYLKTGSNRSSKMSSPTVANASKDAEQPENDNKKYRRAHLFKKMQSKYKDRAKNGTNADVNKKRNDLPIASFRNDILSTIDENQVVIISGETGCGKSTQVPQYIAEHLLQGAASNGSVVCTQPRRISAMSIANRVSYEMGDPRGSTGRPTAMVGYQIRLESKVSEENVLVFCTTGILLRRLESDPMLEDVTHVIVDEVHERSLDSDFLLMILRRLCSDRPDLRVILMSATVNAARFAKYFHDCPTIVVPGRTFPVKAFYLEDVVEKTGYILEDNSPYAKRLTAAYKGRLNVTETGKSSKSVSYELLEDEFDDFGASRVPKGKLQVLPIKEETTTEEETDIGYRKSTLKTINRMDDEKINYELILTLLEHLCLETGTYAPHMPVDGSILVFLPGMIEIRRMHDLLAGHDQFRRTQQFLLIPLHSTLSSQHQEKAFESPPEGIRKIILSTNIAETGVTISDVVAVIDSGKAKVISYDAQRKITRLQQMMITKANAIQRRGRAGRMREGFCFHLFTQEQFDKMESNEKPEILRLPLQELCLRIKVCKLGVIGDVLKEVLDQPSEANVKSAIKTLQDVQALSSDGSETLTPLGVHLSKLPVDVHIGKMILYGAIFQCLDPILTIAAALSFKSPFVRPFGEEEQAERAWKKFIHDDSDFITLYNAYSNWRDEFKQVYPKPGWIRKIRAFCRKNYLNYQTLEMIEDMKKHLYELLAGIGFVNVASDEFKNKYDLSRSRNFCVISDVYNYYGSSVPAINAAITAGLYPRIATFSPSLNCFTSKNGTRLIIHPASVLKNRKDTLPTNFLVYNTMLMSNNKVFVWDMSLIDTILLCLFSADISVMHFQRRIFLDNKLLLNCTGRTASLLMLLRTRLNQWLKSKIEHPEVDLPSISAGVNKLLMEVLKSSSDIKRVIEGSSAST